MPSSRATIAGDVGLVPEDRDQLLVRVLVDGARDLLEAPAGEGGLLAHLDVAPGLGRDLRRLAGADERARQQHVRAAGRCAPGRARPRGSGALRAGSAGARPPERRGSRAGRRWRAGRSRAAWASLLKPSLTAAGRDWPIAARAREMTSAGGRARKARWCAWAASRNTSRRAVASWATAAVSARGAGRGLPRRTIRKGRRCRAGRPSWSCSPRSSAATGAAWPFEGGGELGRVAQPAHLAAEPVQRRGIEPVADGGDHGQRRRPLRARALRAAAAGRRRRRRRARMRTRRSRRRRAISRSSRASAIRVRPRARAARSRRRRMRRSGVSGALGDLGLEQGHPHVEVAAEPAGARHPAEEPQAAPHPAPGRLAREQRDGHAQPPCGDAHLVQVLFAAGQRLGEAAEERLDALLQQRGDAVGCGGCHGKSPESHGA